MKNNWKYWLTRILSAVFFYVGWLLCIEEAARGNAYIGPLYVLCMFLVQLYFSHKRLQDTVLVITALIVGTLIDTGYIQLGLLEYYSPYRGYPQIAPLWVASIWALYAMCINHSLVWLKDRYLLAAVLGAAGAYFSYVAGEKLGSAKFLVNPWLALAIISTVWAIVTPLSLWYTKKLDEWLP